MLKGLFNNYIGVWEKGLSFNIVDPLKRSQRPHFKAINSFKAIYGSPST